MELAFRCWSRVRVKVRVRIRVRVRISVSGYHTPIHPCTIHPWNPHSCFQKYVNHARNVCKPINVKAMGIGYEKLGCVYERMGEINKAIVCMQRSLV